MNQSTQKNVVTDTAAPQPNAHILVVDDTPDNLAMISSLLRHHYNVKVSNNGEKALRLALMEPQPDLILLDIMMPDIDGYEILRLLKSSPKTSHIPVIFLTAKSGSDDEERGLDLGAVDYITKPPSSSILLARIKTHLTLKASADFLRDKTDYLEQEVQRRTKEVSAIQDVTILALASLAETRDTETGNHIRRTQHYVRLLAEHLKTHPFFSNFLSERNISLLFKSAPLHDIGKVGIPDHILQKPGKLTPAEFEVMKTHTTIGWQALRHAEKALVTKVDFLSIAKEITLSHQEKWDGSGYPQGLVGNAIPISARLMALADVYDALISKRVYKNALTHEDAQKIILNGSDSHFDPDIVEAFLNLEEEFYTIAHKYAD